MSKWPSSNTRCHWWRENTFSFRLKFYENWERTFIFSFYNSILISLLGFIQFCLHFISSSYVNAKATWISTKQLKSTPSADQKQTGSKSKQFKSTWKHIDSDSILSLIPHIQYFAPHIIGKMLIEHVLCVILQKVCYRTHCICSFLAFGTF